ncbi:hypothetical protein [Prochlorothrix hollandica]|uniref:Uncharacterized protein n=1 Tax=Prochlorothrix hollandica PCC 9006 = CALU 1027 TaxID=317619 RepID=A0A0M2PSE8_PROHO|nr:hypothetical protein [Prochlorothrix hollandica]KKI99445.1 hypothetical protein PROH_12620 [Prochlorothrix hollandica PCC 9006 = CALU 1027]
MTAHVQRCLTAQEQAIAHWQAEVDQIVARLYGLTDAERALIEELQGKEAFFANELRQSWMLLQLQII